MQLTAILLCSSRHAQRHNPGSTKSWMHQLQRGPMLASQAAACRPCYLARGIQTSMDVSFCSLSREQASLLAVAFLLAVLEQTAVTPWEGFAPDVHVWVCDFLLCDRQDCMFSRFPGNTTDTTCCGAVKALIIQAVAAYVLVVSLLIQQRPRCEDDRAWHRQVGNIPAFMKAARSLSALWSMAIWSAPYRIFTLFINGCRPVIQRQCYNTAAAA